MSAPSILTFWALISTTAVIIGEQDLTYKVWKDISSHVLALTDQQVRAIRGISDKARAYSFYAWLVVYYVKKQLDGYKHKLRVRMFNTKTTTNRNVKTQADILLSQLDDEVTILSWTSCHCYSITSLSRMIALKSYVLGSSTTIISSVHTRQSTMRT